MPECFGGDRGLPVRGGAAAPGAALVESVRIISDLHLGHRVSRIDRVETLRPLLAGVETVIFNGDTWQEVSRDLRMKSEEMLGELKAICREEGCEAIFLPGNHDPGWDGKGYVELAGGRIVVTHGDALLRASSPWKREILAGRETVDEIWARHPGAEVDVRERLEVAREIALALPSEKHTRGRKFWLRALDAVLPPQRAVEMMKAWVSQGRAGAEFCDRYFPTAEFLLVGHFHWGGKWRVGRRTVINTGSFLSPGRAFWVDFRDGEVVRGAVEETATECRRGRALDRWIVEAPRR